jgi:hypothetical protein
MPPSSTLTATSWICLRSFPESASGPRARRAISVSIWRPDLPQPGLVPQAQLGRSTPLHLAVQNTGKSNSGSEASKDEQGRVIALLLRHGASPADVDANGKSVAAAASSDWIRHLLDTP